MKSRLSIFWIKLTNWEYWPWYIVYIPIFIYWLWCGIKTRAIFWISAVNPGIEYGGILGTSKKSILNMLPKEYVPETILISADSTIAEVAALISESKLEFPIIVKPDIGERGFHVELIEGLIELEQYLVNVNEDILLQEYLDLPIELGVFYHRFPDQENGDITSVVKKGMLIVIGDGRSTILELMKRDPRAVQQIHRLESEKKIDLQQVLMIDEDLLLEPIGNHVRGTTFINANNLINQELIQFFNKLAKAMDGFYYGRFDLRCGSMDELYSGKFKVMEVNGAASEPAHIYSPKYPILKGYKDLFRHWKILFKISVMNHKNGTQYMTFNVGWGAIKKSRFMRS